MRDIIKVVIVLGLIAAVAGSLLAGVRMGTMEKIEYQELHRYLCDYIQAHKAPYKLAHIS